MMQNSIDRYVTSLVNGRARVRHPALIGLDADTSESLRQAALSIDGVLNVEVNPRVGSLLVIWDSDVATVDDLRNALAFGLEMLCMNDICEDQKQQVQTKADKEKSCLCYSCLKTENFKKVFNAATKTADVVLDQTAKIVAPNVKNVRRARRLTQNRLMLVAGVSSIAALALRIRWHAGLGWLFTAFVVAHLYQHRRVL